jgi:mRNA degradation ribonuclease J1/J2
MRIRSLGGAVRDDPERLKDEMVRTLRRYFGDTINKRPIIVPYVMEV